MMHCPRSWRKSSVPGFLAGVLAGLLASRAGVITGPAARCPGNFGSMSAAIPAGLGGAAAVGAKTPQNPEFAGPANATTSSARGHGLPRRRRLPRLEITSLEAAVREIEPRRPRGRPIRICLVSSAFSGPTANGGIARAFFSLASHLAKQSDFSVTVLYAAHPYYAAGEKPSRWVSARAWEPGCCC